MFLIGKDLWEIANGTEVLEERATNDEKTKFRKRDNLALATILNLFIGVEQSSDICKRL